VIQPSPSTIRKKSILKKVEGSPRDPETDELIQGEDTSHPRVSWPPSSPTSSPSNRSRPYASGSRGSSPALPPPSNTSLKYATPTPAKKQLFSKLADDPQTSGKLTFFHNFFKTTFLILEISGDRNTMKKTTIFRLQIHGFPQSLRLQ